MKLEKSKAGLALIILYYAAFGTGAFLLVVLIILKIGILAGLAAGLVLGVICGVIGGELEFIEHKKICRKKRGIKTWQERSSSEKTDNVLVFRKQEEMD